MQMNTNIYTNCYYTIIMSQIRSWKEILKDTNITSNTIVDMPWIAPGSFNLWDIFPNTILKNPAPLLIIVENIKYLRSNKYWFEIRNNPNDISIDRFANLVNILEYLS